MILYKDCIQTMDMATEEAPTGLGTADLKPRVQHLVIAVFVFLVPEATISRQEVGLIIETRLKNNTSFNYRIIF